MLKWYGIVGFLLMVFGILIPLLNIDTFIIWYFPILWHGYILFLDSINFRIKGKSLLNNRPKEFLIMLIPYWYLFEFFNLFVKNWYYVNFPTLSLVLSATILPAYFETDEILSHLIRRREIKLNFRIKLTKIYLYIGLILGLSLSIITLLYPKQFFWSFWFGLFFIFDILNYLSHQPSIISYIANKNMKPIMTFSLSGLLIGILFEIFNTFSTIRWVYTIPVNLGPNVFGLPILVYLGYIVFALNLFAVYHFVKSFFLSKTIKVSSTN